ncbi:PepSY-associated TM helix domain-containing protein [Gluconacetobacter asukensis]|uniref:PepSY domain-containing protein n=1 Tax=Gluconacetobacter asukensis TaxID=1017181 RepID=A0A7W4IXE5_9PROT|nr:PepSY-associated TM helix domain-containing protein [Gluconacetobacter asukensis]MBB2170825.1 PepSY domain-containing protein [Gluconacetobacter asukensis]
MKIRSDIVAVYREVHSWAGILAGLFLFVAFYAGAVSMFEQPLQNWLTPPTGLPAPVPLDRTPELMEKTFAAFPEARAHYTVVLAPDRMRPGRLMWPKGPGGHGHGPAVIMAAALAPDGTAVTVTQAPSEAVHFIDELHQKIGLPLPHEVAMPIMGVVALVYAVALVSGVIAFLPALTRTLFAVRLEGGRSRAWLDLHNLFGFFSLPFHVVMAVTSVVFAFHEQIFAVQGHLFHQDRVAHVRIAAMPQAAPLAPRAVVDALARQAPGFVPDTLEYAMRPMGPGGGKLTLRVAGHDVRFGLRGSVSGFATLDPYTGRVISADYLPGRQSTGFAIVTAFFALHFGSYGGAPVRWGYLVLGFGGAFLFYTGNRLWIMARRRSERRRGMATDSRGTWILSRLTLGCTTGCMIGVAVVLVVAAMSSGPVPYAVVSASYYGVFVASVAASFCLAPRMGAPVLLLVAAASNLVLALVAMGRGARGLDISFGIAVTALLVAAGLMVPGWRSLTQMAAGTGER